MEVSVTTPPPKNTTDTSGKAAPSKVAVRGEDEVGALLADHDAGGVGVGADDLGHGGGVGDAEAVDAADAELGVEHGARVAVGPHAARRRRVVHGRDVGADVGLDLRVGPDGGAREDLGRADVGADPIPELARDFDALNEEPEVVGVTCS